MKRLRFVIIISILLHVHTVRAQSSTYERPDTLLLQKLEAMLTEYNKRIPVYTTTFPNASGQSLLTPVAWSSYGTSVFACIGGDYPAPHRTDPDLIASAGFSAGNPLKAVEVTGMVNVNDVSKFGNLSYNLLLSRALGRAGSISLGGTHVDEDDILAADFGQWDLSR